MGCRLRARRSSEDLRYSRGGMGGGGVASSDEEKSCNCSQAQICCAACCSDRPRGHWPNGTERGKENP